MDLNNLIFLGFCKLICEMGMAVFYCYLLDYYKIQMRSDV